MRRNVILFAVVALAQLALPAWLIRDHERVRSEGEVFKFRTAPVDPRDPFRGEFVYLSFAAETGRWSLPRTAGSTEYKHNGFAILATDSAGFASITTIVPERPASGAYLAVDHIPWETDTLYGIQLPFDRYYLEEGDGPKTEELLRPQWNDGIPTDTLPAYAVVRVLAGKAVIEDLIVGDRSIHVWLQEMATAPPQ